MTYGRQNGMPGEGVLATVVGSDIAQEALTLGAAKLPIKTKFVTRIGDA